ncbi:MAG TPA: DUF6496 domain-containing protein [Myxococcota bacterium]|jgi:hypothetical protein|nr:DUF6496 domain-containing protein [Myxococcota bacterium]
MPTKQRRRTQRKSASTRAGEYVREEIHHVREGKHGARSTKQAIAIGLSKARRAGVKLGAPKRGAASATTRKRALRDLRKAKRGSAPSPRRSRATKRALEREGRAAASKRALAKQAASAARRRGAGARSRSARKAVRTKGHAELSRAARKAARTRARGRSRT